MEHHGVGRGLIGSRGRARLVALVAAVTLTAGPAVVLDATSATSASAGPKGYTTLLSQPESEELTCQLASVDLGAGGAVTPIGPSFTNSIEGCPVDLAIRAGDARVWAVVQPCPVGVACRASTSAALGLPLPGATANDEPAPAADGPAAAALPSAVLVTIDPTTGVRTPVGVNGSLGVPAVIGEGGALAFDAAGTLWFYGFTLDTRCDPGPEPAQCFYRLDTATGAATFVAKGPQFVIAPADLVIGATASCENVLANVLTILDGGMLGGEALNTVNTTTGALTPRPNTYGSTFMRGLERDAAGTLWGIGNPDLAADPEATFTIDPVTGAATKVADLTLPSPEDDQLLGLAIAGLVCPVEIAPRFTG